MFRERSSGKGPPPRCFQSWRGAAVPSQNKWAQPHKQEQTRHWDNHGYGGPQRQTGLRRADVNPLRTQQQGRWRSRREEQQWHRDTSGNDGFQRQSGSGVANAKLKTQQQRRTQPEGRHEKFERKKSGQQSFSVFIDGLGERITRAKLRSIFGRAGNLCDVFIQQRNKYGRRFRYGFVRFQKDEEAWRAIRMFHGLRLEGNFIVVQKAKIQRPSRMSKVPSPGRYKYEIQGRVWRPKGQPQTNTQGAEKKENEVTEQQRELSQQPVFGPLRFTNPESGDGWFRRCAQARTLDLTSVNTVQDELSRIGMYNFRLIPLGANEVILEFENNEEMLDTITECRTFLEQKLSDIRPCTALTFGVAHLVWIRLWQVPLGLWSEHFFTAVGNRMGNYVLSDAATLSRHRVDYARVLVRMHHPLVQSLTMSVDVDGTSCIILVEKDYVTYDYGCVENMPTTPWKEYVSEEDDSDDDDMNDGFGIIMDDAKEKDFQPAVDVVSDEEDEVYRDDRLEGLAVLEVEAVVQGLDGGLKQNTEEMDPQTEPPAREQSEAGFLNSQTVAINSGINSREQLQDLFDAGYTLNDIEEWRKNLKGNQISDNGKQILNKEIQNPALDDSKQYPVTGYSFNSKDLVLKTDYFRHSNALNWGPRFSPQQQTQGTCLPGNKAAQNVFLGFQEQTCLANKEKIKNEVGEAICATEKTEVFVHTTPNQIVRKLISTSVQVTPKHDQGKQEEVHKQISSPTKHVETPVQKSTSVIVSPQTNSSQKSSQRGRPKGSKNKPKPLPIEFLEPVPGEDGVTTRAQRTWLVGKQLGLKARGSEALMIRGLEAQIRQNHPHLN